MPCAGSAAPAPRRPQARAQLAGGAHHGGEVLDAEEDGLEHREDLVFDPAQPLARVDALDVELAEQLTRAVFVGPPISTIRSHWRWTVKIG